MSIAEALCPHTLSIFAAPPLVCSQEQPRPLHELTRRELIDRLRHVNEIDDAHRAQDVDVLAAALSKCLTVLRSLSDGGEDVAAAIAAAESALLAVGGEEGEGQG